MIKTNDSKHHLVPWILEKFPENYREMTYIEPFLGGGSVFLNKDRSSEEILNEADQGLASVWRALRDEPKVLLSKLRKVEHTECTFNRHKGKSPEGDYIQSAVSEFILRHMSRGSHKKAYLPRERSKEHFLEASFHRFLQTHERLSEVYILNKDAISILRAFSNENTLVYCDPPSLEDMDADRHMELGVLLRDFKGKVIISGTNNALYRRLYLGWNRKGVPGKPKESVWLNF